MTMLSPNFFIGNIRIGIVEGASSINFGNNASSGFESYKKQNQGVGNISGDGNELEGVRSLLNDSAIMDMLIHQKDHEIPQWLQTFIQEKLEASDPDDPKT
ncbi:hypothetical protein ACQCT6_07625 [Cytobacillus gottheilii]|uniref:hypothetical protein n=1 Tax=Cytobacillus gottheilii TaxID=859144 RepID=UPI003CF9A4D5